MSIRDSLLHTTLRTREIMATNTVDTKVEQPRDRTSFQIGIMTALDCEAEAVLEVFDKSFDLHGYTYGKHALDENSYSTGLIEGKPIVLCQLASIGKLVASKAAHHMRLSFSSIKLLLVVGVAGGNPWAPDGQPILLGDVALSTRVIEMDFGRLYFNGTESKKGVEHELTKSDLSIRNFLTRLRTPSKKHWLAAKVDEQASTITFPDIDGDGLYNSDYIHKHRVQPCDTCQNPENQDNEICNQAKISTCQELDCDSSNDVRNVRRSHVRELIHPTSRVRKCKLHFGIIASGSSVVKSARHRDLFCKSNPGVVAFEMEAAGTWETFPTIVVKGICDYADSHKDRRWQAFSATRAAVCAKLLIKEWTLSPPAKLPKNLVNEHWLPPSSRVPKQHFVGYSEILERLDFRLLDLSHQKQIVFVICGMGGIGKTETVLQFLQNPRIREIYWAMFWIDCTSDSSAQESFDRVGKAIGVERSSIQDVKYRLASGSQLTLLILDNCNDSAVNYSNKYIPFASHVRIILTGRTRECERYASYNMQHNMDCQYVSGLSPDASIKLVLVLSKDHRSRGIDDSAAQLAKVLGHHPLAIHVACSFIRRYTFTISDYINAFGAAQIKNDGHSSNVQYTQSQFLESTIADTQYKSIYDTFDVTIDAFSKNIVDATVWSLDLLCFAACIDRSQISLDIFLRAWSFEKIVKQRGKDPLALGLTNVHVGICRLFGDRFKGLFFSRSGGSSNNFLSQAATMPKAWSQKTSTKKLEASLVAHLQTQFRQMNSVPHPKAMIRPAAARTDKRVVLLQQGMALLCEAELATFEERGQTITFHPVVHAWAKLRLDKSASKHTSLAISGSILALAVGDAVDWNPSNSNLRLHLEAYLTNDNWNVQAKASYYSNQLWTIIDMSRAHVALAYSLMHMDCTRIVEELKELVDTLEASPQQAIGQMMCLRARGLLCMSLPRNDPTRVQMQKSIIDSIAASIVPGNTDIAHNLLLAQCNLADAYLESGKTTEAIQYLEQLEQNYPTTEWDYDRDLLAIKTLLGVAYRINGEYDRARKVLQKVVRQREEFEEEDNQLLCSSRTCLADVYIDQLDFSSALQIMEKTLKVMVYTRTEDDHFLLLSRQTAAKAYAGSGNKDKGIEIMKNVLNIRNTVYGLNHSESIETAKCLQAIQSKHKLHKNRENNSSGLEAQTSPGSDTAAMKIAANLHNESTE